ncbi:MAG: hypothetical protein ACI30J_05735 [Paludibacteraceae bacterium]
MTQLIWKTSQCGQKKMSATNVTVANKASHSTSETIVISEADAAKIRKEAENAIKIDAKILQKAK